MTFLIVNKNTVEQRFMFVIAFLLRRGGGTENKTASLADEGNSAYCQSSGAHNIKHI